MYFSSNGRKLNDKIEKVVPAKLAEQSKDQDDAHRNSSKANNLAQEESQKARDTAIHRIINGEV